MARPTSSTNIITIVSPAISIAFSALTLLVGQQVIYLERGADLHVAQLIPPPLTVSCFSNIQIVFLPFWYRLTRVVLDKGPLNGCVCVCGSGLNHDV